MEERVVTVGAHRPQKVRNLDFRRPMKFTRDHLRVIERAQDAFCRSASSRLSAELRSDISLSLVATDQLGYGAVMAEEMPQQSLVLILEAQPIGTQMLIIMENSTALGLVSRSLGGALDPATDESELTELEITVAKNSLSGMVEAMSAAWQDLCGITLTVKDTETSPVAVQIASPSEPTLLMGFDLKLDDQDTQMTVIVPWSSIDPVIEQIDRSHEDAEIAGVSTARAIGRAQVSLVAEAGSQEMSVSELLAIPEGGILSFPQLESDGVVLAIEGQPLYQAQHGANQGQRAAQVSKSLQQ